MTAGKPQRLTWWASGDMTAGGCVVAVQWGFGGWGLMTAGRKASEADVAGVRRHDGRWACGGGSGMRVGWGGGWSQQAGKLQRRT
jgi:hypothetical protein